jgi:hypothetical protein
MTKISVKITLHLPISLLFPRSVHPQS